MNRAGGEEKECLPVPPLQFSKWAPLVPPHNYLPPQGLISSQRMKSPCAHCLRPPPLVVTQILRDLRETPEAASGATHLLTSLVAPR